ncbi:peroxin [Pleurotus ostreatus]|uniref:Peroxin n=1 Tax=Pleurotus ostreatus TaxID=5322 RepID=A0A8H7A0Z6_PLEOS|nr:peroxin [Pleurotus ostreatus]KAF7436157.1 peroxin [Pleurotus ostreatus]
MLSSVKQYVSEKRATFTKAAGVVGSVYLAGKYVSDRLEETREQLMQERSAKDNLRRRFYQNQEHVSFTVMALISTLSEQVVEGMDVESVTGELQAMSKSVVKAPLSANPGTTTILPPQPAETSTSDSLNNSDPTQFHTPMIDLDAQSETHSAISSNPSEDAVSNMEHSSRSWMTDNISIAPSSTSELVQLETPTTDTTDPMSLSVTSSDALNTHPNGLSESLISTGSSMSTRDPSSSTSSSTRTKSELCGLRGGGESGGLEGLLASLDMDGDGDGEDEISEEVERKFLTLSWWMLHVGWKDVGERVRKGVEDALDGVSLKSRLGIVDVHRIVSDIRRRVEHEITFEGTERRIDFLSTLLPPTAEMTNRVLSEGGFFPTPTLNPHFPPLPGSSSPPDPDVGPSTSPSLASVSSHHPPLHASSATAAILPSSTSMPPARDEDPQFSALVEETRRTIASPDFARVFDVCMERAVEVLFDDLEKEVYFPNSMQQQFVASEGNSGVLPGGDEVRIKLAALLPGLTRWSREVLNGLPNTLVDTLTNTRETVALSAIVFTKFEDRFNGR